MISDEVTDGSIFRQRKNFDTFVSQQNNNENPKMLWHTTSTFKQRTKIFGT